VKTISKIYWQCKNGLCLTLKEHEPFPPFLLLWFGSSIKRTSPWDGYVEKHFNFKVKEHKIMVGEDYVLP
jgi:hypothetical protein